MITKLNSNLLDVTVHFTDNVQYYSYSISEIYDPAKKDYFERFFNFDPIVCDVTCKNDLVSTVIHDYLDSDYIFDIIENLNKKEINPMACFLVPTTEAIVTTVIKHAADKKGSDNIFIKKMGLNDCYTNQDLGIALAYERGIFSELNHIDTEIDFENYFNFEAYGRDCRINEDWDYYDGSFWKFWNY